MTLNLLMLFYSDRVVYSICLKLKLILNVFHSAGQNLMFPETLYTQRFYLQKTMYEQCPLQINKMKLTTPDFYRVCAFTDLLKTFFSYCSG